MAGTRARGGAEKGGAEAPLPSLSRPGGGREGARARRTGRGGVFFGEGGKEGDWPPQALLLRSLTSPASSEKGSPPSAWFPQRGAVNGVFRSVCSLRPRPALSWKPGRGEVGGKRPPDGGRRQEGREYRRAAEEPSKSNGGEDRAVVTSTPLTREACWAVGGNRRGKQQTRKKRKERAKKGRRSLRMRGSGRRARAQPLC